MWVVCQYLNCISVHLLQSDDGTENIDIEKIKEFFDGEKVDLHKNTICSGCYVILAFGVTLSIFSIIVNSLLVHGVRKVIKHNHL